ncbi:hypothetical protein M9H77_28903 [Catharanthus roseus]|uniref:Uncharacterized protein n=1 Tax=Catharanthus roseus TaxID=4058 RepID=A0ACC0AIM2_CATRO|nr:hypothetical protein M9H77_28903 [Catharanthus roseus]
MNTDQSGRLEANSGFWEWNTPLPYIYCGLGILLAAIACSLFYLLCIRHLLHESDAADDVEKQSENVSNDNQVVPPETRIVVVFPGDDNHMYIAKPLASKF